MKGLSVGLLGVLFLGKAWGLTLTGFNETTLNWGKCPEKYAKEWPAYIQCAELVVPMDWNNPSGPKITLTMNKVPATNPKKRIGSLVLNPGGPGGSGMEYAADGALTDGKKFSDELREHFDLIGPDPRGIGFSTPIRCNPSLWNKRVTRMPKNESEFQAVMAHWKTLGEDCKNRTGPAFDHFDTISVARDIEAIRIALGEGPLNYFGSSYGTQLGSRYLELFPGNIRAVLLDANTDLSINETNFSAQEMLDYETVLNHFISWAENNDTSPLKGRDVGALVDDLWAKADENPIKAPECRQDGSIDRPCFPDVSGEDMKFNIQSPLSFPQYYPTAAQGLLEAEGGNATMLSSKWYTQDTHQDFSQNGAACSDWPSSSTWAEWQNRFNLLKSYSPHLKGITWALWVQISCQPWPSTRKNISHDVRISGLSAPVLMVNALYDPQSPYIWAVNQQRAIEGATLLTRAGDGHTSYVRYGETQKAMDAYLINLTVPDSGTVYHS